MIGDTIIAALEQTGFNVDRWRFIHDVQEESISDSVVVWISANQLRPIPVTLDDTSPFGGGSVQAVRATIVSVTSKQWKVRYQIWAT